MTIEKPTYRPQGVNYLGFLAQQLGDLRGSKTLAHELIQNADDAKDESGKLAATLIEFDIQDGALIVHNDAVFRETDFNRMSEVASGSKRSEAGERTTGAFGVGFISVYQITDRPEIQSGGRRWVLRPDESEDRRIEEWLDRSITRNRGTMFRLPWAFEDSRVRRELKAPPVTKAYIDSFVGELKAAMLNSILFLKTLEKIEVRRNGEVVTSVERIADGNTVLVRCNEEDRLWRVFEGDFSSEAHRLKKRFGGNIETNRSSKVRVAVADSFVDDGLLYATLPTEQVTGLPFHIEADFFPAADRKSIPFGDHLDYRSEWNRAALEAAAEAFASNLIPIRDVFRGDPAAFWTILNEVNSVQRAHSGDELIPLGAFWKNLLPELPRAPIVFTQSEKWLPPGQTRITTGRDEESAIPAFRALGLEMVHESLWSSRNALTQNGVGVRSVSAEDIRGALAAKEMFGHPTFAPPELRDRHLLKLLWHGIQGVLVRTQGASKSTAEAIVRECSLAPGIDGKLWPCRAAFQADESTQQLFSPLLSDEGSFLGEKEVPLLEQLCPKFTVNDALDVLESIEPCILAADWNRGAFTPKEILKWFDRNKSLLIDALGERLAELPIYPSAKGLNSLKDLWLPGGFDDPIGVADLLDTSALGGLLDFLRSLGARELRFEDYARRYISEAFSATSGVPDDAKRGLLEVLGRHIGEVRDESELRAVLSMQEIVECTDGVFRRPAEVYLPFNEIVSVMEDFANYAKLPKQSDARRDLYGWLGVADKLRLNDVLKVIGAQAASPPRRKNRAIAQKMLEVLGSAWASMSDTDRESCEHLRTLRWLPAEGDTREWHSPGELHAAYQKYLFASQAKFIDIPLPLQQRFSDFFRYFGLNMNPHPRLVVRHLLSRSGRRLPPPRSVYQWLNDNASAGDLKPMGESSCLWVGDRYFSPKHAYWGNHPFGGFRVQLGSDLRAFQKLLSALEIRESPDFSDAISVLKEVSAELGSGYLNEDEYSVVLQCWVMLSDALDRELLETDHLETSLRDTRCVPNKRDQLHKPSWMYFEDRPSLVVKFPELLEGNVIGRIDRAWTAMAAAGVTPLSQAVHGMLVDTTNPRADEEMKRRVAQRALLIKSICEDASNGVRGNGTGESLDGMLDALRLVRTEQFTVKWRLQAFDREWPHTSPEQATAHWNAEDETVYFAQSEGNLPPWSAIAREMTHAVVPEVRPASVSPGLKTILEANTYEDACNQLIELGISSIESLELEPVQTQIVEFLDYDGELEVDREPRPGTGYGEPPQDGGAGSPLQNPGDEPQPETPFAKTFYDEQTTVPSRAGHRDVSLPEGGPRTDSSAKEHTEKSLQEGRAGNNVSRMVTQWELQEVAQNLANEFRSMVHGDYGRRCQICSRSFAIRGGELQIYVVHVVPPSEDRRTNHFGDLLGLCGWHFSLMRYGEWCFLDPDTYRPFRDTNGTEAWEHMRDFVTARPREQDDIGNTYVGIPIRFSNVYRDWDSEPRVISEEIRYSIPHWKYLCELLKT